MRFLFFIVKNIWRNPRRTLLTIFGVATALFLFCFLFSIHDGMRDLGKNSAQSINVLVTDKNISAFIFTSIPERYANTIKSIPFVVGVTPEQILVIPYKTGFEQIPCIGIKPEEYRAFREFAVTEGNYDDFRNEKKAALVGIKLKKKYGWKVGQTIISSDSSFSFTIRGIISQFQSEIESYVFVHFDYIQDVSDRQGMAVFLLAKVQGPSFVDQVIESIDGTFANYPVATKSQSETQMWNTLLEDLGPIIEMFSFIGFLAIGAALVGTINTISMSVRERRREVATLKTLGFSRGKILGIIMAESVLISLGGGALGCFLAYVTTHGGDITVQVGPHYPSIIVTLPILLKGLIISVLVGFISGFFPARKACSFTVIDGLKSVD